MKGFSALAHETALALMAEVERLEPNSLVLAKARGVFAAGEAAGIRPSGRRPNEFGDRRRAKRAERLVEDQRAAELYQSGLSLLDVGKALGGHSPAWVLGALNRTDTPTRQRGNQRAKQDMERVERIRAARSEHPPLTLQAIGAAEHITRERVRQICVAHGIDSKASTELTKDQHAAVAEYLAGDSLLTVAGRHEVGTTAICNWIYRAGHVPRPSKRQRGSLIDRRAERAAELYQRGLKLDEIAAELGLNRSESIYYYLAIAGISPNRHHQDKAA